MYKKRDARSKLLSIATSTTLGRGTSLVVCLRSQAASGLSANKTLKRLERSSDASQRPAGMVRSSLKSSFSVVDDFAFFEGVSLT